MNVPWKAMGVVLGQGKVCLGVAPSQRTGGWIVWISVFGADLHRISGWSTLEQADATLARYVSSAKQGRRRLVEALSADESSADGYRLPQEFTDEEYARVMQLVRAEIP